MFEKFTEAELQGHTKRTYAEYQLWKNRFENEYNDLLTKENIHCDFGKTFIKAYLMKFTETWYEFWHYEEYLNLIKRYLKGHRNLKMENDGLSYDEKDYREIDFYIWCVTYNCWYSLSDFITMIKPKEEKEKNSFISLLEEENSPDNRDNILKELKRNLYKNNLRKVIYVNEYIQGTYINFYDIDSKRAIWEEVSIHAMLWLERRNEFAWFELQKKWKIPTYQNLEAYYISQWKK